MGIIQNSFLCYPSILHFVIYMNMSLYDSFCGFYPKYKISAKLFLNKVRQFKKYHPGFEEDTIDKNGNWSQEGRDSLSGRYIVFIKKPKVE